MISFYCRSVILAPRPVSRVSTVSSVAVSGYFITSARLICRILDRLTVTSIMVVHMGFTSVSGGTSDRHIRQKMICLAHQTGTMTGTGMSAATGTSDRNGDSDRYRYFELEQIRRIGWVQGPSATKKMSVG